MSVELLADESLGDRILRALRQAGFTVSAIREDRPGLPDMDFKTYVLLGNHF